MLSYTRLLVAGHFIGGYVIEDRILFHWRSSYGRSFCRSWETERSSTASTPQETKLAVVTLSANKITDYKRILHKIRSHTRADWQYEEQELMYGTVKTMRLNLFQVLDHPGMPK